MVVKRIQIVAAMLVLISQASANDECFKKWSEKKIALQPGANDQADPRTQKPLSQTDGAKRTRDVKLQALKDRLALRGREDPEFKKECGR